MPAGVPSGPRCPDFSVSEPIDWTSYRRVHSDYRNLLIHVVAVPLFVGSFVSLIFYMIRGAYVAATIAFLLAGVAMVAQGRGHRLEEHAPVPFSGPGNFFRRWFTEQFLIFPWFFMSGRWWHQYRAETRESDHAA